MDIFNKESIAFLLNNSIGAGFGFLTIFFLYKLLPILNAILITQKEIITLVEKCILKDR